MEKVSFNVYWANTKIVPITTLEFRMIAKQCPLMQVPEKFFPQSVYWNTKTNPHGDVM